MMKVLFVSAGNNIHTVRWVNSLKKNGVDVEVVSLKNHHNSLCKNKFDLNIKIHYLPFKGSVGYYLNYFSLKKIVKKTKPDLINVHYASGYGTLGSFIKSVPKLLNVWGSDVYDFPYQSLIKEWIVKRNINSYDKIASTSFCMANQVKKIMGKNIEIEITPFGVDTELFRPLNLKKDKIIIGIVKTMAEKYGIEYLIKAFKILCEKYKNENVEIYKKIYLEIYGKGPLEKKLKALVKELEIENKVSFCGYVENSKLPEIINKFSLFAVPSILDSESFGVAAVEAMACEIPVVVSDADGLAEVVIDKENGFIVPKKNEKELAIKIGELIENELLREEYGRAGRKRVKKLYDWNRNVEHMIDVYKKVVREG